MEFLKQDNSINSALYLSIIALVFHYACNAIYFWYFKKKIQISDTVYQKWQVKTVKN